MVANEEGQTPAAIESKLLASSAAEKAHLLEQSYFT
ncbi:hypothetical protein V2J09_010570 [Rumex salicifolius]